MACLSLLKLKRKVLLLRISSTDTTPLLKILSKGSVSLSTFTLELLPIFITKLPRNFSVVSTTITNSSKKLQCNYSTRKPTNSSPIDTLPESVLIATLKVHMATNAKNAELPSTPPTLLTQKARSQATLPFCEKPNTGIYPSTVGKPTSKTGF